MLDTIGKMTTSSADVSFARHRIARLLPPGWSDVESPLPVEAQRSGATVQVSVERFPLALSAGLAKTPLSLMIKDLTFVEAGLRAAEAGYDVVFVDTVCDYGLPELRNALDIPVAAAGESAVRAGIESDRPFAIVTVWAESTAPLFRRLLERAAAGEQCVGVRHVFTELEIASIGGTEAVAGGIHHRRARVLDAIVATCRDAIKEQGAEVIVLGCTCMSPAAAELSETLGVPVIDPLAAGLSDAYAAAASGSPCRAAGTSTMLRSTAAEHVQVRTMITALQNSPDASVEEECSVCIA